MISARSLERTLLAEAWLFEAGLAHELEVTSMVEEPIHHERMPHKAYPLNAFEREGLMVIAGMNPEMRENRRIR